MSQKRFPVSGTAIGKPISLRINETEGILAIPIFRVALTGDFLNEAGSVAYGDAGLDLLSSHDHVHSHFISDLAPRVNDADYWKRLYSLEVQPEHIASVDGLIVLRPRVNKNTFAAGARDLFVIGRSGAGYDKIDLDECTEHGVAVFNAPLALNHSTASSTLLFMLALAKRLFPQDRITRQGRWDRQAEVLGSEIFGRTLGIVGLGHSGRELARLVAPFQMTVLAYSPHAEPAQARSIGVRLVSLEDLMRESDFVSLHSRLTEVTRGMITAHLLALMKPSAYFINVARGELVDQRALTAALADGKIAGAGLDVFDVEPLPLGDPLFELDNVILTPHWSASTSDVWMATGQEMARGMLKAASGQVPDNVVNPEVLGSPRFLQKLSRFADDDMAPSLDRRQRTTGANQ
jgi:phosphoglycerate dehydrogenase-like enzyme